MWQNPLILLPSDTQVVWIRVGTNYGDPVLAEYDSTAQTFTSDDSGLIIPAYMVARWKEQ
jgi:hypothetical protein